MSLETLDQVKHIPLHLHTEFSLLDGASRIEDICAKAKTNDMPGLALTDHGTMFGAYKFYTEAKKHGIKPIVGCEIYVINGDHLLKGKEHRLKLYHLVLLAKNDQGYLNLIKIVSESCINGFYYKPRVSKEFLRQYSSDLVAMSACLGGEVNNLVLNNQMEDAKIAAANYKDIFGEDFYLEIMDHNYAEDRHVNPKLVDIAKELNIKIVATNDSHYTNCEDANAHDALLCLQTQKYVADFPRMHFSSHEYLKTGTEMAALFADHLDPDLVRKAVYDVPTEIFNKIEDYELLREPKVHMPDPKVPEGHSFETYLREISYKGAKMRFGGELNQLQIDRLDFELEIMNNSGFASYFIVVWDFIKWARENDIPVGPGRGSAAGSLVAYALEITNIDPLKYDLLFERFLNPERKSMPDIDTDFCIEGRADVIEYVRQKYGEECVCQIITFNRLTSKSVIKDMARVLEYPYVRAEELAKMIPVVRGKPRSIAWMIENHDDFAKRYKGDPEAREVIDLALKNEGLNKTFGVHAAGVIIADQSVDNIVPISRSNDGSIITQFAMEECAYMGLLKMDFLGLRNLTMIKKALNIIEENSGLKIDIDKISMEDSATFDTVCSGHLSGVFQLETSAGMKQIARDLAPRSLEDISALIALYRPGPLDTGMVDDFIDRKSGKQAIKYEHPLLEPILRNTYGTIVYQEQIMQIVQTLGGFSLGEADLLRRAMGKKRPEVLLPYKDQFIKGCQAHADKIPASLAETLFEQMLAFAEYCFNKSHSTAYGFVTYQTAYLKTHYPVEYVTALFMSSGNDSDRLKSYLIEAVRLGIKVIPPDINLSNVDFRAIVKDKSIVFGMKAVKGVGDGPSQSIVVERNENGVFKDFFDFCCRIDHKKVNKKTIESLIKCGAFDGMGAGRKAMIDNLESFINRSKRSQEEKTRGQGNLFAALGAEVEVSALTSPNYMNGMADEFPEREMQEMEYQLLGLFVNNHPMQGVDELVKCIADQTLKDLDDKNDGAKIKVAVLITDFVRKLTKKKKNICILNVEDMESRVEAVLFSKQLEQCEAFIEKGKRVLITGTLSKHSEGDKSIMIESLEDIDNMGVLEFDLDISQLGDYFQFLHSLRTYAIKPINQGNKIIVLNMINGNERRKISLGAKHTINDFDATVDGVKKLIIDSCKSMVAS
ncbi:MAG: DNA polymerase III subunit alpha [Cyanobacteria bacterium]|nr:DNA polymerase III subunit alpha [Cyanobacteriota bacterium]